MKRTSSFAGFYVRGKEDIYCVATTSGDQTIFSKEIGGDHGVEDA